MTQLSDFFNQSSGNKIVPVIEGEELPFTVGITLLTGLILGIVIVIIGNGGFSF